MPPDIPVSSGRGASDLIVSNKPSSILGRVSESTGGSRGGSGDEDADKASFGLDFSRSSS